MKTIALVTFALLWLQPALAGDKPPEPSLDDRIAEHCPAYKDWQNTMVARLGDPKTIQSSALPKLRSQLLKMAAQDQQAREVGDPNSALNDGPKNPRFRVALKKLRRVDAENLHRLKTIIAKYGFPTATMVGSDGVSDAWLLIQHADDDPDFQAAMLEQMKPLMDSGDIQRADVALLTDRLLCARGLPQRYGSQYEGKDGVNRPQAVEDSAQLDTRRATMELPSMQTYACVMEAMYGQKFEIEPWPVPRLAKPALKQ